MLKQGSSYEEEELLNEEDGVVLDSTGSGDKSKYIKIAIVTAIIIAIIIAGTFIVNILSSKGESGGDVEQPTTDDEFAIDETYRYSTDEYDMLRSAGYTAYEIEQFELAMESAFAKVDEARAKQKEFLRETNIMLRTEVTNSASPEYKRLLSMTFLGGEPREVKPNEGEDEYSYIVSSGRENVTYEKVPAHGYQLYIKLMFPDGEVAFMETHPSKYFTLRDKGNIVIEFNKVQFGADTYFMNIREVPIQ